MVYRDALRERDFNAMRDEGRVVTLSSPNSGGGGGEKRDYRIVLCGAKHESGSDLESRHITVAAKVHSEDVMSTQEYVALIRRKSGAHDFVVPTDREMLKLFKGEAIKLCTRLIRTSRQTEHDIVAAARDGASMYDTDPAFREMETLCGQMYKLPKILPRVFQIVYKTCVRHSRSHYISPSSSVAPIDQQCTPWSEEAIAQRKSVMSNDKHSNRGSSSSSSSSGASPNVPSVVREQYATSPLDINKINDNDDFIGHAANSYSGGEISIPLRAKVMSALTNISSTGSASRAHAPSAPRKKPTAPAAVAAGAGVVPTVVARATAAASAAPATATDKSKKRKSAPSVAKQTQRKHENNDNDSDNEHKSTSAPAPPRKRARTNAHGPATKQVHAFYATFGSKSKQFSEGMAEFYKGAGLSKKATLEDKYGVLLSTFREQCDKPENAMPSLGANFFFAYTLIERFREQERAAELRPIRDKAAKWDAHVAAEAEAAVAAEAFKHAAALINKKKTPTKQSVRKIFEKDDDDDDDDNDDDDDDDDDYGFGDMNGDSDADDDVQ